MSCIIALFQLKPNLQIPQVIQILFPYSLFGKISWWLFFQIFQFCRKHHVHILAGTGAGKSFLILQMILRDIQKGIGVLLIDPHSQLINIILHLKILQLDHKKKFYQNIVLLDFESTNPPAFNIFKIPLSENKEQREIQIHSIVQNYMEAFEKAFEIPHGTRRVLKNVLIILFEFPNATILDLLDILKPKSEFPQKYQNLISNTQNQILKRYFEHDFFTTRTEFSKEALRTRIEHLLIDRQLRLSMTQQENSLDIQNVLNTGKIVLVKAGENIGVETSRFLGALVHQLIIHWGFRRIQHRWKRKFSIYLDECQNYMCDDISKGLDEARKSGIQYVLAHQRLRQRGMTKDQQRALNACAVKMYGRLEYEDAWRLCRQLKMKGLQERFLGLREGEFYIKFGFLKTRFIKFPKQFAPRPETIGIMPHSLFAQEKQFWELIKYLEQNTHQNLKSTEQNRKKSTNHILKFSLNDQF